MTRTFPAADRASVVADEGTVRALEFGSIVARLADVARSRREPALRRSRASPRPGQLEALIDLERADEHCLGLVTGAGDDVHAVMEAVDEVHVEMARRPEHDRVASGAAARGVRGQVLRSGVGLDLHDPAADPPVRRVMHQTRSEQLGRQLHRGPVEPGAGDDRRRDHGTRRSAISSGTKGRARKPAVGISVSRKKAMSSESLSAS